MDLGGFVLSLLGGAGQKVMKAQFGIAPVDVGGVSLFRLENLTVNISLPADRDAMGRGSSGRLAGPGIRSELVDGHSPRPGPEPVQNEQAITKPVEHPEFAGPFRLEPLLVFDLPRSDNRRCEFEIAPRVRVAMTATTDADMAITLFSAAGRKRYVCFDGEKPVGIRSDRDGDRTDFNSRKGAKLGKQEHWSFRTFPTGRPVSLATVGVVPGSIAVAVDDKLWAAAWLFRRKDPTDRVRESSFLILVQR